MAVDPSLKPVRWIGPSRRDFRALPDFVKSRMGYALYVAQQGGKPLRKARNPMGRQRCDAFSSPLVLAFGR